MASSPGEQAPQAAGRTRSDENVVTRLLRNLAAFITSLLRALFRSPSKPSSSSGPQNSATTSADASANKNNYNAAQKDSGGDKDIDLEQGRGRRPTSLLPPLPQHDLSIDMASTRQFSQQAPAHAVAIPRMPPSMLGNGHGRGGGVANKENLGKQKNQHQHQPAQLTKGVQSLRIDDAKEQHDELPQTLPPVTTTTRADVSNGAAIKIVEELDPVLEAAKVVHREYMHEALEMARLALRTNETPVGCVLVYKDRIIAKGMNATNVTRNGTRHAELMAISALMSYSPASDTERAPPLTSTVPEDQHWGDVDPRDGHLYPYGQKLHPAPRVSRDIISECVLYVTVEPCVMCASLLRQLRIKKVYFGAVNDKFGGTGGVFRIHKNSTPLPIPTEPVPRPVDIHLTRPPLAPKANYVNGQPRDSISSDGSRNTNGAEANGNGELAAPAAPPPQPITAIAEGTVPGADLEGDGGNVELGYDVEGGWGRDEAVNLLRQFYVQENGRAPVPRKKEGRAARLAAMMEKEGMSTEGMNLVLTNSNGSGKDEGEGGKDGGEAGGGVGEVEAEEAETNGAGLPELEPSPEVQATSREEMSPIGGGGVKAGGRGDGGD